MSYPNKLPAIPSTSGELRSAVRALARAAMIYRQMLCATAEGTTLDEIPEDAWECLALADAVINAWAAELQTGPTTGDVREDGDSGQGDAPPVGRTA